jgi:hypothetical protein
MKKFIVLTFAVSLHLLAIISCSTRETISSDNVLQIKNTGLRQGVFIRRFQLTGDYGNNTTFSADMLKNYISRVLEPNYLLIQHAYDLGMNENDDIARKVKNYRVNLLADNHPVKYQEMTILKKDLRDLYEKKSTLYKADVIQTASYREADSLRTLLLNGESLDSPKEYMEGVFPRFFFNQTLVYGEGLHPELLSALLQMREGDISQPVYAASIWTIIKVNKLEKNSNLPPFEQAEQSLLAQAQSLFKYEQQKQLVEDLKISYTTSSRSDMFKPLIAAFSKDRSGFIDAEKLDDALLNETILTIGKEEMSTADFVVAFNQSSQFRKLPQLSIQDLEQFVHDYTAQFCLYLDAVEKGVEQDELIQDKLQNKEHRLLLSAYLNEKIMKKLDLSDKEIRAHYDANPDKWRGSYDSVMLNVKGDLRKIKLEERKSEIVTKLKKKYNVMYNDALLHNIAAEFTRIKKAEAGTK